MSHNAHAKASKFDDTSINRVKKQKEAIKSIRHGNELLKSDLAWEARESRFITNPSAAAEIQRLQDQADIYAKKTEQDRRKIQDLDRQIAATQSRVLEQRQKMGGLNASQENNEMIAKQIRTLENRLDKALVKFNESLAMNKNLRERIDTLRRERVVFDSIYKKLERELHEKKKEMAAIINDSNNAYHARDKAQSEMMALRQQAEKDRAEFDAEWKELGKLIAQDRKLRETLRQRQLERSRDLRAEGESAGDGDEDARLMTGSGVEEWGANAKDRQQTTFSQPEQSYEAAFNKIKEATGMTNVTDMVNNFLQAEEKNFSLFNFVNELNSEIERLELMIAETKNSIEKFKGQGVSTDTQRKKVLRGLEEQLSVTEGKADDYERRYQTAMKTINQLKTGIHSIFSRIGAGSNSSVEEMLGNQGVTESNMMQYLGIIEQRTSEILQAYAASQQMTQAAETQGFTPSLEGGAAGGAGAVDATVPLRLNVQPPAWDDFSSGEDSDQEDDERPLTREELKRKTLRGGGAANGGGGGGGGAASGCAAAGRGGGAGGAGAAGNKPKDGKARTKQANART
ncbi:flagellar outer dynein arm-docking complex [Ectocarpus siliculosus]|uniref:Flagellar outer dynein arm-docking complex n=1 Tax=Ectocarpus siliculosus TaxID=2880 RepID=D8LD26_ECTSI|nr:flagellar outer dynein arm-docking complex [Ectocarpus siliculosus]|eukprot:CBN78393.1 flagellar outer dynein arm-docking complex [Ectocarpus siliculosus]